MSIALRYLKHFEIAPGHSSVTYGVLQKKSVNENLNLKIEGVRDMI
jgi:hypothetical protein